MKQIWFLKTQTHPAAVLRCFAGAEHWQCFPFPHEAAPDTEHTAVGPRDCCSPGQLWNHSRAFPTHHHRLMDSTLLSRTSPSVCPNNPFLLSKTGFYRAVLQDWLLSMCLYHDNYIFQKPQLAGVVISSFSISLSEANNFYVGCVWQRYNETKEA